MTITLTPKQLEWLKTHVAEGRFTSVEDGVRQLVDEGIAFEDDDLAWAKPYVDEALAAIEEGKVITLEEHKARMNDLLKTMND